MESLLNPIAAWMDRLRFSRKFVVTGVVALLLIAGVGWAVLAALHQRAHEMQAKRAAVALMGDLVEWNKVLIDSRRVAISAGADSAAALAAFRKQAETVNAQLQRIETAVKAAAPLFDMAKETEGLRQGWAELQTKVQGLPADAEFPQKAFAAHAPEYGRLYAFMRDLGNKSGMAQDPDADIFYLGYPLANHTPSTAGIAVRIAAYATLNIARKTVSAKDKVFYEVTEARLNDTFGGVETMLSQSMKVNPVVEKALAGRFEALKSSSKDLLAFVRKNFTAVDEVAVTEADLARAAQPTIEAAWALVEENRQVLDRLLVERGAQAASKRNLLAAVIVGGVLLSVLLYLGMYRGIVRSLGQARAAARAIALGELGGVTALNTRDELGELVEDLRRADQALAGVIAGVKQSSESIATATSEIATGTQDLSARTEQTAGRLQQTASSMEQLTGSVRQSTDAASTANQLASSAASVASRGGEVVAQVVATMDEINGASKRINDIIGVIDGIAFQTNILALNAAVEAARAGEQGRGFAVVAGEVRSLAQRSAEAAREIKALIGNSVDKVESGSRLVGEAGTTMQEIVTAVRRVTDMIAEISAASGEQSQGIGEVNVAVTQLDQMTQQNAALVEESAAAAESLREQAAQLAQIVGAFRLKAR